MDWMTFIGGLGIGGLLGGLAEKFLEHWIRKREIRFEKLHERRFEVIRSLHQKLINVECAFAFSVYHNTDSEIEDKLELAANAARSFYAYFTQNKIYFEQDFVELVEKVNEEMGNVYLDLSTAGEEKSRDFKGARKKMIEIVAQIGRAHV